MRKILYILASVAALGLTACDNDDGGNNGFNQGFAPNSCFATGGTNQYQFRNGGCVDIRNNQPVAGNLCNQAQFGNSIDPRCNQFTQNGFNQGFNNGFNGFNQGFNQGVNNPCAWAYGFGWQVQVDGFGQPYCLNTTFNQFYGFNPSWVGGAGFQGGFYIGF